ncbi:cytochrome c [Pseudorhodoferax sp. Leaf265]|jgi:cytochrome c553|uniref:c-type cytochrome n=1 Tax=Pseudorhodoferax sp. Leaf265 TaxID=1736315 RepID=UPI0006F21229|nr:c-type cytochrome [Pseudorhodoferax sp. Leaf265]KQP05325.1 cytochrome C [Pseudorhodoferax sp. Leaf265]PZP92030.1 MAG: cytochrome c4 [Variovorax paradoxus]PZQ02225.1 MAG: cytochrome c4 [Variovorax paradoxus]
MNKLKTTVFALAVASVTALGLPAMAQQIKGDPKAGLGKADMCIGCHGIVGYQTAFPEVYKVPKISGQGAPYIAAALNAYKTGDRRHPSMRGIAESLTDQDIADLAAFYSTHVEDAPTPPEQAKEPSAQVAALLQKGACVSCHGANFAKPIDGSYPKIAGQHADYLFVALKAYKTGASTGLVGRSNGVMAPLAKQFSNAELKAISNYLAGLEGGLQIVPESRFRTSQK